MATLEDYRGLEVLNAGVPLPEAGGKAISDNFRSLVDWNPKSDWEAITDPTSTDDLSKDFQVGSQWLNSATGHQFVCTDNTTGSAKWKLLPAIIDDSSEQTLISEASASIVISPGLAIQLDSGGDARGSDAIDFQATRTVSTQVASGAQSSIVCGAKNTASGQYSVAGGENNLVSGVRAVSFGGNNVASGIGSVVGGEDNTASGLRAAAFGGSNDATAQGTFAGGEDNSATAAHAAAFGTTNTAGGAKAFAAGASNTVNGIGAAAFGDGNTASGATSFAGGTNNTTSGASSAAFGDGNVSGDYGFASGLNNQASTTGAVATGNSCTAAHQYSMAGGAGSYAGQLGQWSRSVKKFNNETGALQASIMSLIAESTSATPVVLSTSGSSSAPDLHLYRIATGQTVSLLINVVGRKTDGGKDDNAAYLYHVIVHVDDASASPKTCQIVAETSLSANTPTGWGGIDFLTGYNTSGGWGYLKIEVTGEATSTIRWHATVVSSEAAQNAISLA